MSTSFIQKDNRNYKNFVSSFDLARALGTQANHMRKRIDYYKDILVELSPGKELYYTDDRKHEDSPSISGRNPKIYWLTPAQAMWLVTKSKASEEHVETKVFLELLEKHVNQRVESIERKKREDESRRKYGR